MPTTLDSFTKSASIADTDRLVGFANTNSGGERSWPFSALKNAVLSSNATLGIAKAWVIFDGSFANSPFTAANGGIIASHNVDSVTDNGNGDYTVNFANGTMSNTNYMAIGYPMDQTQNYRPGVLYEGPTNIRTTSQYQVYVFEPYQNTLWNSARVQVVFYGGN
jgi:hypothetical protein